MESYKLLSARDARENGFYEGGEFILERPEGDYEPGLWLLSNNGGYAKWYGSIEALIAMAQEEF